MLPPPRPGLAPPAWRTCRPEAPPDPAAEALAAARRAKSAAARTEDILAALDALDVWMRDQLQEGIATFPQRARVACRAAAQRLVDGKAAGLALMLDELPATLFGLPDPERPGFVVRELGRIHLAAAAFRRGDALPAALQADAQRATGWGQKREDLLADPAALRVVAEWTAAGTRTVTQADRLRRVETWLAGADGHTAVLVDYVAPKTTIAAQCQPGERFTAELAFYPSAAPLRAIMVRRDPSPAERHGPAARLSGAEAWAAHLARLAALPWLGDDLLVMAGVQVLRAETGLFLSDPARSLTLPLPVRQTDPARPLVGLPLSAAVLWDGRAATLLAADTPLGPWFDG